jgi:1-acyl-sn-glycerol-3-phosphate acyltransferase
LKTIWYNFIRIIIKTGLFFYSNRIRVSGKENIPKKGAVLFAVNHPNGLIDPLIVTTSILRKNHYLVRAASFKKPIIKKFLETLNLMPIYRIRDGASQLGKNQEIFDNCFDIFKKGETLMIFPEGSHNRKRTIRPLSKGFTRIVFGAIDKYPDLKITIVPVGLTYQNASYYPTKVAVVFGKPIAANDFYNPQKQNISVVQLKNEVSYQLKKVSVHINDDKNYETTLTKLNEAQVDFTDVEAINKRITSNNIPEKKTAKLNLLKPLYYLIIINSIFPFIIWKLALKKVDEIEFIDTFRFTFNLASFIIFYSIQTWLISSFFGGNIAIIYLLVSVLLILIYSKFSTTNTETKIHHELS